MRRDRSLVIAVVAAVSLLAGGCNGDESQGASPTTAATADGGSVEALTVNVIDRYPHDTAAFTEGLTFDENGRLYESLGLEGESTIREVDPETGEVLVERALADDEFGEGIAVGPDGIVQLTWKNGVAHVWQTGTLEPGTSIDYEGEGWGLTFDGTDLLHSDGSSTIAVRDPETLDVLSRIEVTRDGVPVDELNELEWVDGLIYANVWHSDEIMRIDPGTGRVTGVIDASGLWQDDERTSEMTLNGIAHRSGDPATRLWLTGKNWPEIFEVEVVSA